MRLQDIKAKLPKIREWLAARGAEVLEPTNDYEVLRFRTSKGTAVVYRRDNGGITCTGEAQAALTAFATAGAWSAGNATKRRHGNSGPEIVTLIKRDGPDCFYCLKPLGEDITREHLLALPFGGTNHIANKVLTHRKCNERAGHLPVLAKLKIRESNLLARYALAMQEKAA